MTDKLPPLPAPQVLDVETSQAKVVEWSGDHLMESADAEWVLSTEFPISVDELWAGPRGITRIGPGDEGYAGYLLPTPLHEMVKGTKLAYVLPADGEQLGALPRQLEVGASIKDGNGSEKATVVAFDDEAKQMILESKWYEDKERKPLHYTWEVHALEGEQPGTSILLTKMRMAGVQRPRLWQRAGPAADRMTLDLARQTIIGEDPGQIHARKLGATALVLKAGELAGAFKRRRNNEPKLQQTNEAARPQDVVVSFTTSKGSVYTYDVDGHTTRFKTATEKEQPRQDLTVFVGAGVRDASRIAAIYLLRGSSERSKVDVFEIQPDGSTRLITDSKQVQYPDKLVVATMRGNRLVKTRPASLYPRVGAYVFDSRRYEENGSVKTERHLGHKVTAIKYKD